MSNHWDTCAGETFEEAITNAREHLERACSRMQDEESRSKLQEVIQHLTLTTSQV